MFHALKSANKHAPSQAPNDTLHGESGFGSSRNMADDFRRAFLRHLDEHGTSLATLSRETGVSLDVLKKLKTRATGSTSAENAMLIAAYYGKSVNQFVAGQAVSTHDRLANLLQLLTPSERQLLEAQMMGLIAAHGRR